MRLTIIYFSCLFLLNTEIYSQTLVNKEWENNHGNPLGMDWTSSKTNNANQLLHVGNTFVDQEGANVKTTKYDNNGLALWEAVYNSQENFNDYGIALEEDSQGNIYVLGTTDNNNTATNFDILLLKYGNNGSLLWSTSFNSSFDKNDVGTDLKLDSNGNIYVCAVSEVSAGNQDYLILKYTNNGTLLWSNRYDYAALSDIPIGIDFDINGDIFVTGSSASSLNNWDYTIARFSSLGNLTGDARFPLPGVGFDQPLAFRKDLFNNTYITGRTSSDGINYDIKTIKLNPSFVVQWERTLDFEGKNDEGQAIDIDENGNVYIGGYVSKANNIKEAIVVKYDANGNEIWNKKYKGSDVSADAMIKSLKAKNNDEIYILGEEKGNNGTKDAVVSKLNAQGGVNWQKKVTSTADDKPKAIHVSNNGNVFVSLIKNGQLNEYSNVKFNEYNKGKEVVLSPSGKPLFVAHELVVRFHQNALKTAAIDNTIGSKVAVFGDLDYYLRPNALLSFNDAFKNLCIQNKNSTIANPCGIKVVKIFKELKTTTTTTTNRLGDIINVPDFWTTLLLVFPPEIDLQQAYQALKSIPSVSVYSEPNYLIELTSPPNDPLYNLQTSLFYETFQDDDTTHINMQEAWDIVPKGGENFVKCGVFDTGIEYRHADFGYDWDEVSSGKVQGYDFELEMDIRDESIENPDENGHGTKSAGIIGANRNNGIGIAGIAGGNYDAVDSLKSEGVKVYALKILSNVQENFFDNPISYVYDAIVNSTFTDSIGYKYGLHLMNHSWTISNVIELMQYFNEENFQLLKEAVHFVNRMQVSFVAARGNNGNDSDSYPAIIDDDWVLSVYGTNIEGQLKDVSLGDQQLGSSFGKNVDVGAPCESSMIRTTANNLAYQSFNATSASAPHVTAAVALLMSYLNDTIDSYNNLAPEDCERILELSATDINTPGPDYETGYGRLNVGKALRLVEKPWAKVLHFGTRPGFDYSINNTLVETNNQIYLKERCKNNSQIWFEAGNYIVNTYQINATILHDIQEPDTILYFWPRPSLSNVLEPIINDSLVPRERLLINSCNQNSASLSGYIYEVFDLNNNPLGWWPLDTTELELKLEYTLLTQDKNKPNQNVGVSELLNKTTYLKIFPNPSNSIQEIELTSKTEQKVTISLLDLFGKEISQIYHSDNKTNNVKFKQDISFLNAGVYFYKIEIGEEYFIKRIVKL